MDNARYTPRSVPTDLSAPWPRGAFVRSLPFPGSLLLAVFLLLGAAVPVRAQGDQLNVLNPGPELGATPELSWTTTEGEPLTSEDFAGKVVLLDFWASWCIPCQRAVPHLKSLDQSLPDDVFRIVGVNVDDEKEKLQGWVATYGLPWTQVWDRSHEISKSLNVTNFPTYILLDHQGRVTYTTTGFTPTMGRVLDYRVRSAVNAARAAQGSQ